MKRKTNLFIKRFFDFFCSFLGLILISWLLIILAIVIKCSSRGPIFFKQERLGRNGQIFRIIKFRTMVVNAEKTGDGIYINSESDSRITNVGKFLRKTSIGGAIIGTNTI